MDLNILPPVENALARLAAYQHERAMEEERRLVAEIIFRRDLGEKLTDRDRRILAYSPWGTAANCHC